MDWRKGAQSSHLNPIYALKTGGRGLRADFMVSHFRPEASYATPPRNSPRRDRVQVAESTGLPPYSTDCYGWRPVDLATRRRAEGSLRDLRGFGSCERQFRRRDSITSPYGAERMLLPVCRLHHLCDAGPLRLAQQGEHALLLCNPLTSWFVRLRWDLRRGGSRVLGFR